VATISIQYKFILSHDHQSSYSLDMERMSKRIIVPLIITLLVGLSGGCADVTHLIIDRQPNGDDEIGITYYIGGAGPIGNVGSFDVPQGLRDAGYEGSVEVFTWQSWTHAGDQINLSRNLEKAAELADRIRRYRRDHPNQPINLVALSAGTGIAVFALEYLPEDIGINQACFLSCSLSSRYDLTRALKRINGNLYVLYSPHDRVLNTLVWYTGTIDRSTASDGIAGLEGFYIPSPTRMDTLAQYQKVTKHSPIGSTLLWWPTMVVTPTSTSRSFVRRYLAPALFGNDKSLLGPHPEQRYEPFPVRIPAFHSSARPASPVAPTFPSRKSEPRPIRAVADQSHNQIRAATVRERSVAPKGPQQVSPGQSEAPPWVIAIPKSQP